MNCNGIRWHRPVRYQMARLLCVLLFAACGCLVCCLFQNKRTQHKRFSHQVKHTDSSSPTIDQCGSRPVFCSRRGGLRLFDSKILFCFVHLPLVRFPPFRSTSVSGSTMWSLHKQCITFCRRRIESNQLIDCVSVRDNQKFFRNISMAPVARLVLLSVLVAMTTVFGKFFFFDGRRNNKMLWLHPQFPLLLWGRWSTFPFCSPLCWRPGRGYHPDRRLIQSSYWFPTELCMSL